MKIIKSKIFRILILLFIIGFALGIITYFILDKNNFNSYILNYFSMIKNDYNYFKSLIYSISYNYKYLIILWICGLLLLSYFICPILVILMGVSIGLLFTSIILTFGIKGLLYCLILFFPCILINNFIYIIVSYYSINISNRIYKSIKLNLSINFKSFFKNYFYILLIFLFVELISSIFEIYISSNIIKFVV